MLLLGFVWSVEKLLLFYFNAVVNNSNFVLRKIWIDIFSFIDLCVLKVLLFICGDAKVVADLKAFVVHKLKVCHPGILGRFPRKEFWTGYGKMLFIYFYLVYVSIVFIKKILRLFGRNVAFLVRNVIPWSVSFSTEYHLSLVERCLCPNSYGVFWSFEPDSTSWSSHNFLWRVS